MKKRHIALSAVLTFLLATSSLPSFADQASDQGLPPAAQPQLQPMQPMMATPANYYPTQAGGSPQAYPPGTPTQAGYPPQYGGQQYPPQGGYPQAGAPYQAGVQEAVPGQQGYMPQQQMPQQQMPPQQQMQPQQQMPMQGYQQPSPYEMQEQAIQKGHMQNRNDLDKYNPPPDVPDAVDPGYRGEVSKGPGMKGIAGKAAKLLTRTTQVAAPYAASFLVTTAAYKMANRNNNRGYRGGMGMGGYGMPMGGYGVPMGGMPGMGMYGMPGMGMGMPMYGGYGF